MREPRGLTGCLPGAPRVPGAGAARAHRVPSGSATRPPTEKTRIAFREDAVCPRMPKTLGRADFGTARGRAWAASEPLGLAAQHFLPATLVGWHLMEILRGVVWGPCFPYHRHTGIPS